LIAADREGGEQLAELLAASGIPVTDRFRSSAELDGGSTGDLFGVVVLFCEKGNCLQEVRQVADHRPDARTVVVSPTAEPGVVRRIVSRGAAGFVRLADVEATLAATVKAVAAGQLVIPFARRRESTPETLTTREKQILALVVMGLRNGEIAAKLFLAESTIKSHLSSAFTKLGVASRNEAAALILDPRAGVGTGILTIPTQNASGADW